MKVLIKVIRDEFHKDWTLSTFDVIDAKFHPFGHGIEDEIRTGPKVHGETAIPYGTYLLGCRYSPKFSSEYYYNESVNKLIHRSDYAKLPASEKKYFKEHELIWVMNVEKFMYVLIHWGNTDDDTDACYVVGSSRGWIGKQRAVLESRKKYIQFYEATFPQIKKGGYAIEFTKSYA